MSILDANQEDLRTSAVNSSSQPAKVVQPGVFDNFGSTAGNYFMRGMAEVGRSASMAAAAVPVVIDKIVGDDNMSGRSLADRYFQVHDEVFGRAVDYWTPRPEETGRAGQVVGSLAAGITQFLVSPGLAVANAQLSTSEELVRQGVRSDAALVAGDIAALGTVLGIALPIAGNTLGQRIGTGVAGNIGQGVATAAGTQAVLREAGAPGEVVEQFNPFDPTGRTVDILMGAVFGAKAHLDARLSLPPQSTRDALMTVNQARHLESVATPGRPVTESDFTTAVDGVRSAIDQMVRGEPVAVDAPLRFDVDEASNTQRAEMQQLLDQALPASDPVPAPKMMDVEDLRPNIGPDGNPAPKAQADTVPLFDESVRLPTGDFDPKTGEPTTISANDFIARAQEDAAQVKTTAPRLLAAAAECLLGSI